ncbi:D-galactonate dehydratase [Geodia barretti]|uniref:D-galactonate dehydratase n=1 Tax=Geodia barretti TaxID=519541 RepID=A0AA35SW65_GEOBA|nr:D-galactonate dehydratase [Geodia barretti]
MTSKTFLVHPGKAKNLCFVKIETDEGIYGWGECYTQSDRDVQITAHVDQLKRYLIGRDPTNIKHFTQMAFDDFAGRRGSMDYYCAISGLEHAMWDIAGKAYGAPVHKLIGGACRDKIRVYANGWSGGNPTPDSLAERASEVIEAGFTALKFDPIPGRWRTYVSKDVERAAVENDSLPCTPSASPTKSEQYRPFWFEEPILAENIPALASVRQKINIPVVTGEELYTKFEFREVFERQAADILNPDVCNVGGILELKEMRRWRSRTS